MKFQVNDKVKYDSGDWQFYGTVTAVIENSINPCYRLNVDRMTKKNCKFSITQFEFELEPDNGFENDNIRLKSLETAFFKKNNDVRNNDDLSQFAKPEPISETEITSQDPAKKRVTKRLKKQKGASEQTHEIPGASQDLNSDMPNKKRYGSWETNFDLYCNGDKSNAINTWMYQNRKQYKAGILKEDRFEKLMSINFPFEAVKKGPGKKNNAGKKTDAPTDIWHKQLRQWKAGDSRNSLQQWRQQNVKRYVEGRLSKDKIEKLKEVGILK